MGSDQCYIWWYTPTDQVESSFSLSSSLSQHLSPSPTRFIIEQGAIPPLCELLSVSDAKIIQVAFNGLDNILKLGAEEAKLTNGPNPYAMMVEECYGQFKFARERRRLHMFCLGLDKIEYLQSHENIEIYQKAFHLIETYFGVDDDDNFPVRTNIESPID